MTFITFIIPTIGRESLKRSIQTLLNQDDNDWECIVIFDGVKKNIEINFEEDTRIKIFEIDKIGGSSDDVKSTSGLVRNFGIEKSGESEWIGFLDDDDCLSPDYISKLKKEIEMNEDIEVCIFRMAYSNKYILPTKDDRNINRFRVGISFAIKKYITEKVSFTNNPFEDFLYLKNVQYKKYKIVISSYVTYFVRTEPYECLFYPKILINF
jgi:glycosyltransferase involved in cell wall biosynthesis